jgi:hypothetical protein
MDADSEGAKSCVRGLAKWGDYGGMCWWGVWPCERASRRALDEVLSDGGARELTCCRRRGGRPSRLPVPWEPAVFLLVFSAR